MYTKLNILAFGVVQSSIKVNSLRVEMIMGQGGRFLFPWISFFFLLYNQFRQRDRSREFMPCGMGVIISLLDVGLQM